MSTFGDDISLYMLTNTLVHALNSLLFFYIAFIVSKKQFVPALLAALAFCWSRFALFQLGQVFGALEALALFFFLISLLAILQSMIIPRSASKWLWLAVIASLLCVNTLERYILAPLFYAFAVWAFHHDNLRYRTCAAISAAFLAVVLAKFLSRRLSWARRSCGTGPASTWRSTWARRILTCWRVVGSPFRI